MKEYVISNNDSGQTILNFIKKVYFNTPLSVIYKWFRRKEIKLNGVRINNFKIKIVTNDIVIVYDHENPGIKKEKKNLQFNLNIAYIDNNLLIVIKEPGIPVHNIQGICLDEIVNSYLENKNFNIEGITFKISHAHRLDKPTSGLVIYPLTKESSLEIYKYINNKNVITKFYIAKSYLKRNISKNIKGFIKYDQEMRRSFFSSEKEDKFFKPCEQIINKISENLFEIALGSGKKHQIRAIFSYYNMPLVNDYRYGAKRVMDDISIGLVAYKIKFNFPLNSPLYYMNDKIIKIDYKHFLDVDLNK
ncbi:pseudouridine synthase family protein [Spiroplasma endosymbiont of Aspidapion aeneum]|uniref:pseudouridine synthase family protein n=1 Tax=Spiroplasma endosymbiont of Aspidapion aeneum TaxID=3066276 RepID=UPI00313E287A